MAKFTGLRRSNRSGGGGVDGGDWQRDLARRNKEDYIATTHWPSAASVSHMRLSDDEIVQILDRTTRLAAEHAIVSPNPGNHITERTWQTFGWHLIRNGWCPIPQERGFTERPGDQGEKAAAVRKPAPTPSTTAKGKDIQFAFKPTQYRTRLMPLREFISTERYRGVNVALQCCESSMHIRGLDIDCTTVEVAHRVFELAVKHLGDTPFVRVGRKPKLMLIYRVEGDEDIAIGKYTYRIHNADGSPNLDGDGKAVNAIEFLANGALITAYGLHHSTGLSFEWIGKLHPVIAGPEAAPVITKAMLRAFEAAVAAEFTLTGSRLSVSNPHGGGEAAVTQFDRVDGRIWMPKVAVGQFILDADGYVVEGAEDWLRAQTWAACGANPEMLEDAAAYKDLEARTQEHAVRMLTRHKREHFTSAGRIELETKIKLHTAADKWRASLSAFRRSGEYHKGIIPFRILEDGRRPIAGKIECSELPADGSLDWLPRETSLIPSLAEYKPKTPWSAVPKLNEAMLADRIAREIVPLGRRKAETDKVSAQVTAPVKDFFARAMRVINPAEGDVLAAGDLPFDVVLAPTGAGKTRQAIDIAIAELMLHPRKANQGPALLVVPTHANAGEALAAADGWSDEEIEDYAQSINRPDFKVATFKGREAMECQQLAKLKLLSEKRIAVGGLCQADVPAVDEVTVRALKRDGEKVPMQTVLCEFRERGECAYYNQWNDIETADLVIVTHAYLTQHTLPKPLKNPRLVIIDESVTSALLAQARFPISSLRLVRREPYVTKKDRAKFPGLKAADISRAIHGERQTVCGLAEEWMMAGKDVAAELYKWQDGLDLVNSAITVCDRAHEVERNIRPDMTLEEVQQEANKEVAQDLLLEVRFWKIVRERLQLLIADAEAKAKAEADGLPVPLKSAKGSREMRVQLVRQVNPRTKSEEPHVRISWRVKPNWSDRPMMLLDASANERILGKLFGRAPKMHPIKAPLHVRTVAMIERTWSNSSFIPREDATREEIAVCAETVRQARALITTMSCIYGYGRVLVGATMEVREAISKGGWTPPANVDFCHYGALRGIDRWKHHVCAISIGRSEMPISIVDGFAAALTYDDDEPEEPYDRNGTGLGDDGKPLFRKPAERVMTMRNGKDISHFVPEMPGKVQKDAEGKVVLGPDGKPKMLRTWAQDVEESWREEELRQFLGRLRPVYRGIAYDAEGELLDVEPPVWIAVGKVQPEGVIVDEVVELPQLTKASPLYDIARRNGGVLIADLVEANEECADLLNGGKLLDLTSKLLPPQQSSPYIQRLMSAANLVKVRVPDGRTVNGMVFEGLTENGVEAAIETAAEAAGVVVEIVSVTPAKRKPTGSSQIVDDKFEERTATRSEVREDEVNLRFVWMMMPREIRPTFEETEMLLLKGEEVCGITLRDLPEEPEEGEYSLGPFDWMARDGGPNDCDEEPQPHVTRSVDVPWWHKVDGWELDYPDLVD